MMSEERIQKIKWTALIGSAVAMAAIVVMQVVARLLIGGGNTGMQFGQVELMGLMKAMAIFGLIGATSGAIGGMFTEIKETPRATRVKRDDDDEDADNEAARETMTKLGIIEDRDKRRAE